LTYSNPHVAVVVPNYNGGAPLLETLNAVLQSDCQVESVVVVDDCSSHDSALRSIVSDFSDVVLLRNTKNLGFAATANKGVAEALRRGADYVLLLNNDAVVSPSAVQLLLDALVKDRTIGAVMPLVYFYSEPELIQSAGLLVNRNTGRSSQVGLRQRNNGQFTRIEDREGLHGCAIMIARRAWENVGRLWEPYYAYYEDVDWCVRARDHGYRTCLVPQAHVWHHGGHSFDHASPRYVYLLLRNRLYFVRRNHHDWHRIAHSTSIIADYLLLLARQIRHMRWRHAAAIIRAVCDCVVGRTGPG
jgi:GT2 family glycosyltransferase